MTELQQGILRGIRVVTEQISPTQQSSTRVKLFAHDRSRFGSGAANAGYRIERRDLKKILIVRPDRRNYQELPIFGLLAGAEKDRFLKSGEHWRKRYAPPEQPPDGTHRIKFIYEKTLEREQLFGCTAYRWKIIRRDERDHPHGTDLTEAITDAWYLDPGELSLRYSEFSEKLVHQSMAFVTIDNQRPQIEHIGTRPSGLCARSESLTTSRRTLPSGEIRETEQRQSSRITSLTEELFPVSLFEVPKGFKKIPAYPSRITMARLDLKREFDRMRFQINRQISSLFDNRA